MNEPRFLLDTNICIYLLEGKSLPAKARFESCSVGEIVTSAIVYAEVMIGAANAGGIAQASRFFGLFDVVPFNQPAGLLYAGLPFKRQSFDRLIAAQALALGLIVVTNNERHFAGIPGLVVENWTI